MTAPSHEVRAYVLHPRKPDWGPGKVLAAVGSKVTVYFRDCPNPAVRTIDTGHAPLDRATITADPLLDNLPPWDPRDPHSLAKRTTLDEGIAWFLDRYPLGFRDPKYIDDPELSERAYKWKAHLFYQEQLGEGRGPAHLESNPLDAAHLALSVISKVNLLSLFEQVALRDGLKDEGAARGYMTALFDITEATELSQTGFEKLIAAVNAIPTKEGGSRAATWPILTILPFLASPSRFMFLKPTVTRDCAIRLNFELQYRPELNWLTYRKLLEMSTLLMDKLRPYGARDYIDVQSFIWLVARQT